MVGRIEEIKILQRLLESSKAEMLAVYGRRRVGKTYLIKNVYQQHIRFEFTGTQNASRQNQLFKFSEKLKAYFVDTEHIAPPKTWFDAFNQLKNCLTAPLRNLEFQNRDLHWVLQNCHLLSVLSPSFQ